METKGFNGNISQSSKEALQSETWQKAREAMKPEIQHFTEAPEMQHFEVVKVRKNDNVYGITWGNVVREYLKTAYSGENAEADVVSEGVTYKVLKREEVTAFYDADGNTLFDVENKRLDKEYGYVMEEESMDAGSEEENNNATETEAKNADLETEETGKKTGETQGENPDGKLGNDMSADNTVPLDPDAVKHRAKEKLEKDLKADKDKAFAEPVIGYLLERCKEDLGLAQDVVQEHKTWKKCFDYIYKQARKQAKGNKAAVRDDVVYEWAEDYYRKDDKAEEAKKAKKEAEAKAKREKAAAKKKATANDRTAKAATRLSHNKEKKAEKPAPVKEEKSKEQAKPKKNGKEMEGQLDMFSMIGM